MTSISFTPIHFSIGEELPANVQPRLRNLIRTAAASEEASAAATRLSKKSDEGASRLFLQTYLEDHLENGSHALAEITSPLRPELVPDMQISSTSRVDLLHSNRLVYQQTSRSFPIFGALVSVDVDSDDKTLVAINGKVTPPPDIEPFARISAQDALTGLIAWGGSDAKKADAIRKAAKPPVLTWFLNDEASKWHLVHHFASFPMAPPPEGGPADTASFAGVALDCLRCSPRSEAALYDYFVDAHDGVVVFCFSSTPRLDIPSPMCGIDHLGAVRDFFGLQGTGYFVLTDPMRNIETYDYQNNDLDEVPLPVFPSAPIRNQTNDFGNSFPAAVSAHHHAGLVYDFYNNVLQRDGVDDRGMKLVSVVNVYSSNKNPLKRPQWKGAMWWEDKMWYGQENGISLAKHLDIFAHELTHGVTSSSSKLIYRRICGALNESYSDIFGVIIANWYPAGPQPIALWNWEIGSGLGNSGGPIRDLSNPSRTGQPDHWNKYKHLPLSHDHGGVHIYSGIHNKAIHRLLTDTDSYKNPTFPIGEATLLLYLTLTRLTPTSDFKDSRRTLESVTRTYYASDPGTMAIRLTAIASAYQSVGL